MNSSIKVLNKEDIDQVNGGYQVVAMPAPFGYPEVVTDKHAALIHQYKILRDYMQDAN